MLTDAIFRARGNSAKESGLPRRPGPAPDQGAGRARHLTSRVAHLRMGVGADRRPDGIRALPYRAAIESRGAGRQDQAARVMAGLQVTGDAICDRGRLRKHASLLTLAGSVKLREAEDAGFASVTPLVHLADHPGRAESGVPLLVHAVMHAGRSQCCMMPHATTQQKKKKKKKVIAISVFLSI